jgi:SET domain-containing protein
MPTKLGIPKDCNIDLSKELEEYIENFNIKDLCDQFETTTSKWRKIKNDVNLNKHSPLP